MSARISLAEYHAQARPAKRSKYGAKRSIADGIVFDSKREAERYGQLRILEKAGRIRELKLQVPYRLAVNGEEVCRYVADFTYEEFTKGEWRPVVEDAKGMPTPVYRLKKRLMRAILGIEVRET